MELVSNHIILFISSHYSIVVTRRYDCVIYDIMIASAGGGGRSAIQKTAGTDFVTAGGTFSDMRLKSIKLSTEIA